MHKAYFQGQDEAHRQGTGQWDGGLLMQVYQVKLGLGWVVGVS